VYLLFLSKVHLGGEGTPLRGEVKKLTVTSHQRLEILEVCANLFKK
jgi:hypothetical protein